MTYKVRIAKLPTFGMPGWPQEKIFNILAQGSNILGPGPGQCPRPLVVATGHSIHLDLLDFLALGILVPWALAWAKDTFRYVGHCGLVFEEFCFFGPWGFGNWIWVFDKRKFWYLIYWYMEFDI